MSQRATRGLRVLPDLSESISLEVLRSNRLNSRALPRLGSSGGVGGEGSMQGAFGQCHRDWCLR